MRAERAIDHLLNPCVLSLQPGAGGNQQVFGIGPGVIAAVHARLGVKQIEEVVKVGDFTSASALLMRNSAF
jgi:hypothetical protein